MKTAHALLLASFVTVAPAQAADIIAEDLYLPPIVEDTYDWSGFYVGVHGGYGMAEFGGIYDSGEEDAEDFSVGDDLNVDGFLGGLNAGFNVQNESFVYGIEADASYLGLSDTVTDESDGGDSIIADLDTLATLRGRLGYAIDAVLLYGTAGLSYTSGTWTVTNGGPDEADSQDFDAFGVVFGAGAEAGITENVSLRAEALYHHFGDEFDTSELGSDSDEDDFGRIDGVFEVRAGATFRF